VTIAGSTAVSAAPTPARSGQAHRRTVWTATTSPRSNAWPETVTIAGRPSAVAPRPPYIGFEAMSAKTFERPNQSVTSNRQPPTSSSRMARDSNGFFLSTTIPRKMLVCREHRKPTSHRDGSELGLEGKLLADVSRYCASWPCSGRSMIQQMREPENWDVRPSRVAEGKRPAALAVGQATVRRATLTTGCRTRPDDGLLDLVPRARRLCRGRRPRNDSVSGASVVTDVRSRGRTDRRGPECFSEYSLMSIAAHARSFVRTDRPQAI